MTTYAEVSAAASKIPRRHVVIHPNDWVEEWEKRPTVNVAIGLRALGSEQYQRAQAEAAKCTVADVPEGPDRVARFNDELVIWAVAFAACDPNDVGKPYFTLGSEHVRTRLRPYATRRIFEELEAVHVLETVTPHEPDDGVLAEVAARLTPERLAALPVARARAIRRFLSFALRLAG